MVSPAGAAASEAYDHDCEKHGWQAPDPHQFRLLPRQGLSGWPVDYWRKRAISTATLWNIMEERRRAKKLSPMGVIGNAVDISSGLPYVAYGLDAGGYMAFAVSPNAGRYGLGAYPFARYCRLQTQLTNLALKPDTFDLVIFSGSLAEANPKDIPHILERGITALTADGFLIVTDTPDTEIVIRALEGHSMKVETRAAVEYPESWRDRLRQLRRGRLAAPPVIVAYFL